MMRKNMNRALLLVVTAMMTNSIAFAAMNRNARRAQRQGMSKEEKGDARRAKKLEQTSQGIVSEQELVNRIEGLLQTPKAGNLNWRKRIQFQIDILVSAYPRSTAPYRLQNRFNALIAAPTASSSPAGPSLTSVPKVGVAGTALSAPAQMIDLEIAPVVVPDAAPEIVSSNDDKPFGSAVIITTDECSICLEDYSENSSVGVLPCKHNFHASCITEWVTKSSSCPICRAEASVNGITKIDAQPSAPVAEIPPVQIDNSVKVLPIKSLQTMNASSIWNKLRSGDRLNRDDKVDIFVNDCNDLKEQNKAIPAHKNGDGLFRVASYNVHYWAGPSTTNEQPYFTEVLQVLKEINADVVILEEVVWNTPQYSKEKLNTASFLEKFEALGYKYHQFVQTINFYGGPFGNAILSKYPINAISKKFTNGGKEPRAYINATVTLPNNKTISVYGTHLDVFDETGDIRSGQIDELLNTIRENDKNENILIAADFNEARKQDYNEETWNLIVKDRASLKWPTSTKVSKALKANNFTDCFERGRFVGPQFTVWTGTAVDFIYLNKSWKLPLAGCYTYFDASSDHIPVIMDIKIADGE